VHLHVHATDGIFVPNGDGPPAFLPAHPITQVHLVTLTERVRRRMIRWFRLTRLLDASAAADIRLRADGRQEPAHFEPEVRKRAKARMASPA
jgi:hypothetical protein